VLSNELFYFIESAFYMQGDISDVVKRSEELAKEMENQ
jgi:F-type H+-transporting ATPase subunit beta